MSLRKKKIKDGAKVKDEVRIAPGDETLADLPLVDYEKHGLTASAGAVAVTGKYTWGENAFEWQKEAEEEEE